MSSSLSTNHTIVNGWVSSPSSSRGTFSIISSCVLTLSLCVYTAVHLNIQSSEQHKSRYKVWLYTAKWVALGVFAPELLCFIAWRQWISARSISQTVQRVRKASPDRNEIDSRYISSAKDFTVMHLIILTADQWFLQKDNTETHWSSVHSHYTNMGGFVVDLDEDHLPDNSIFTTKASRLTLTPRGIRLLIECGHVPSVTEAEILDKSKTDTVAQLLALLQTAWFVVQMVARHLAGLQITLLELNTIAHVICAVFVYILWWKKPKNINEPTKLSGLQIRPILAYMFMNSRISGWKARKPGILKKTWNEPEFSVLAIRSSASKVQSVETIDESIPKMSIRNTVVESRYPDEQSPSVTIIVQPFEDIIKMVSDKEKAEHTLDGELESVAAYQSQRWSLAAQAIESYEPIKQHLYSRNGPSHLRGAKNFNETDPYSALLFSECQEYTTDRMPNWTDDSLLRDGVSGVAIGAVLWSLSIFYGGLHAIAWYDYFATPVEQYSWRISCVWIAGSGCIWVSMNLAAYISSTFLNFWECMERLEAHTITIAILSGLAAICGVGYILARAVLVFVALVSLRSMPQDVFDTPGWIQVIPHL